MRKILFYIVKDILYNFIVQNASIFFSGKEKRIIFYRKSMMRSKTPAGDCLPFKAGSFFDQLEVADGELEVVAVLVLGLVDVESDTAHF